MNTSGLHSSQCSLVRGAPFWRPLRTPYALHISSRCRTQRFDTLPIYAGEVILEVKDLEAKVAESGQTILRGVNLTIREGETHAIMGTNGSGKSTLSKCLVGHPDYEVTSGSVTYKGQDLLSLAPEERARAGLFMSFQSPVEVPGVSNSDFLRLAANARRKQLGQEELGPLEFYGYVMPKLAALKMSPDFLNRDVNANFSGGEKKRNEILQLSVLEADIAVLDEIDSGLDIDALRDVADAVNSLKRPNSATLMVTHYKRLLNYVVPEAVHIMEAGRIIYSGGLEVADILESDGYEGIKSRMREEAEKQPVGAT
ncbi:g11548 [Coccomyxa viridis]|uniref:G11548 protein n=1 Tax=Coccomyxa viridis TaxID=1274662 RepID=A0ABP1G8I1_9CHLO